VIKRHDDAKAPEYVSGAFSYNAVELARPVNPIDSQKDK